MMGRSHVTTEVLKSIIYFCDPQEIGSFLLILIKSKSKIAITVLIFLKHCL